MRRSFYSGIEPQWLLRFKAPLRILRAVQDADDLNAVGKRAVVNHIVPELAMERPVAKIGHGRILEATKSSQFGHLSQQFQCLLYHRQKPVSCCEAALRNV